MFDIGWTELLLIGIVALIVVGPKDLPGMFRTLGQFTAKAKRMAREFTSAMEAAADDAGVKDVAKGLKAATDPKKMGLDALKNTVDPSKFTPGSSTQKLAEDRAAAAAKIQASTAKAAETRLAREAETAAKPADAKPAKKAAAKKSAPKEAAAKKPAAKKPAPKKTVAKKPAAKSGKTT